MSIFDWKILDLESLKIKSKYMTSKNRIILSPVKYLKKYFKKTSVK